VFVKQIRKRLTYANVMSSLAVFLVLGGATAFAAKTVLPKKSVGTPQLKANAVTTAKIKRNAVTAKKIKKNAITTAKIKNEAVTGAKVNESTLGTVPSAAVAQVANSLDNLSQFKLVRTGNSSTGADFESARAGATAVTLYDDSHFTVYGKCFVDNSGPILNSVVFIAAKQDGAIFDSDDDELDGDAPDGYLSVGTPEEQREVIDDSTGLNASEIQYEGDTEFGATAADGYTIHGDFMVAEKFGSLAAGDGPFGPGDVCLFSGQVFHSE
jgi:hypothetical protein